ncbi:MAG TPA: cupredoxin domain-containing protein [Patescibacteria group bacterium]|nr:cupredoxin domain-containing protein [Patescibacteria group bacterium]
MSNKILIGTIAVLVLGIGAFALLSNKTNNQAAVSVSSTPTPTITSSPTASATPSAKMEERNVNVTANGFVPQTLKINAGTKVTWTNKSGVTANVSSDPHPIHTLWPFLNLGNFADGSSVSVTFDKTGIYTYHNHLDPSMTGTVIVQ